MNAKSMPLKHDHQQYGGADAPFRTMTKTTPTTRTTIVTRAIAVCVVVAAVAGVTYLSTGRYPRSPVAVRPYFSIPWGHRISVSYYAYGRIAWLILVSLSSLHFHFFFLLSKVGCYGWSTTGRIYLGQWYWSSWRRNADTGGFYCTIPGTYGH